MKSTQLEFNWDETSEPTAKAVGEGSVSLEDLRTPKDRVSTSTSSAGDTASPNCVAPRGSNYDPGHPWYYLPRGDNSPPIPAKQIPASEGVGRFIEGEVPKDPFKRTKKLRQLLDIEQHDLSIDIERYQEIAEKGVEALTRYDREIAHGGDDELARASALALKYNHIAWGKGRVAWLEGELEKPAPTRGRRRRKRGE